MSSADDSTTYSDTAATPTTGMFTGTSEGDMTTPESLSRRQYRMGIGLLVLGVFTVAITIWFGWQDRAQRDCLGRVVAAQNEVSRARSELVAGESQATRRVIVQALKDDVDRSRIRELRTEYRVALARIDAQREANQFPVITTGVCER